MNKELEALKEKAEKALEEHGDTERGHFADAIKFAENGRKTKLVELKLNAGLNQIDDSINDFDDLEEGMQVKDGKGNVHTIKEVGETGVKFEDDSIHRNPEVLQEVE